MVRRALAWSVTGDDELHGRFAANRAELGIEVGFPPEVLAAAEAAAAAPRLPHDDLTAVPFVTLDPPPSRDLDQAFHLERRGGGFRVRYAIADVAAWVSPGSAVDASAHARALTSYSPDVTAPLHPRVLSEGAASLLPDGPRPAVVWTVDVDASGVTTDVDVRRALVASRAKLDYPGVQAALDAGTADAMVALLPEVGALLQAAEAARGGMSLNLPSQSVTEADGEYALAYAYALPVEDWNAQLSLLTGRAAAALMLDAGVGILRTMPAARQADVDRLRRIAKGLGIRWPGALPYADLLRGMDSRNSPAEAAFLQEAASLFRGAAYTCFDGAAPELVSHAAIAAPYTHCTAPLRRLVDRYAAEVCLSAAAGRRPPEWVLEAFAVLPSEMAAAARRDAQLERMNVDTVEAAILAPFVGHEGDAVVVDVGKDGGGVVAVQDPAVVAGCDGPLELGQEVRVRLVEADVSRRRVRFAPAA